MAHASNQISSSSGAQAVGDLADINNPRPVSGSHVKISTTTPPSRALQPERHVPGQWPGTDIIEMAEPQEWQQELVAAGEAQHALPQNVQDAKLQGILKTYLTTEKNREMPADVVLPFVREQLTQLARPENQRNWAEAERLYLEIHGVDDAKLKDIKGGLFKGGWIGSGSLYALSGQLMTLASMIPAIYTYSVSPANLKKDPVYYAWVNLGAQVGVSLATPFVNSAMQIIMVARQELMRGEGQSARSKEMKARGYDAITAEMKEVATQMDDARTRLDAHREALRDLQPGSPGFQARREQIEEDSAGIVRLLARSGDLAHEFQVRHGVIDLNYVGQFNQSLVRVFRSVVNMTSAVTGLETANTHLGNLIQIGGTLVAMGGQQFWAAPADVANKEQKTLGATIMSTRLVRPESRNKPIGELEEADLDISDLSKQWKGPISTAKGQFQEYLDIEIAYCEQGLGDLVNLEPHEFRRLEQLENKQASDDPVLDATEQADLTRLLDKRSAVPVGGKGDLHRHLSERLDTLRQDARHLKADTWMALSPENRASLLEAVSGDSPWSLSAQTAWARMRLPADFIAQIAQRFGSQFAMVFAGTNMPLILNGLFRLVTAYKREEGKEPPIPNHWRDVLTVAFMLIAVGGALSTGAGVNDKITQRSKMKSDADSGAMSSRVGFQPSLAGKALKAISQAMFAFPTAVLQRRAIDSASTSSNASRERLDREWGEFRQHVAQLADHLSDDEEDEDTDSRSVNPQRA